jgi:hypothetical protein
MLWSDDSTVDAEPALQTGRIPIVLGVTGHRTLPDEEMIAAKVREQMQALRERYPHSPFAILSPLAEGADRLVARLAMDVLRARLLVPLPMPEEEYRTDFAGEASQGEYDALRDRAESVFELDMGGAEDAPGLNGEARNRRYAMTGAFVADRSQILFAIWDGEDAAGTGGTGDVAQWAIGGHAPLEYRLPEARDRPFYYPNETELIHVHPETGNVEVTESADGEVRAPLERLDRYNEEVATFTPDASAREQSVDYLLGEASDRDDVRERLGQQLLSTYAVADTLSIGLQTRFRRYLKVIYALSAGGIVGFAMMELWPSAIAVCLSCTAAAIGVLQWTERQELEDRYLHARALAEGLRVAVFWSLAGVHQHTCNHYFGTHVGEMAWTRLALQNVETTCRTADVSRRAEPETDLALVEKEWVQDQRAYYDRTRKEAQEQARWLDGAANVAFAFTFLVAAGIGAYVAFAPEVNAQRVEYVMISIELALAFGVSFRAYKSKLGLDAVERHYEKAHRLFEAAGRQLKRDPEAETEVLRTLGRDALLENSDWLWMNQTRDVETPTVA